MDYHGAVSKLKDLPEIKVMKETYLEKREDGAIAVRLNHTDVLTYYADNRVKLNANGYRTNPLQRRLNTFLPTGWHVFGANGKWFVSRSGETGWKPVSTFEDGMTINPQTGETIGALPVESVIGNGGFKLATLRRPIAPSAGVKTKKIKLKPGRKPKIAATVAAGSIGRGRAITSMPQPNVLGARLMDSPAFSVAEVENDCPLCQLRAAIGQIETDARATLSRMVIPVPAGRRVA